MNQAKRSVRVATLMDQWYTATKAAKRIRTKLEAAMAAEAPFKIGDIVAVIYPGYTINIGKRPLAIPTEIHKGSVAAVFSNPKENIIEYAVSPALFSGGYHPEKRITVSGNIKIEPWNGHHQYLVRKVLAERKKNGTHSGRVEKRPGNDYSANRKVVDTHCAEPKRMGHRVSPFLRDDWRASSEWRQFAFPE